MAKFHVLVKNYYEFEAETREKAFEDFWQLTDYKKLTPMQEFAEQELYDEDWNEVL